MTVPGPRADRGAALLDPPAGTRRLRLPQRPGQRVSVAVLLAVVALAVVGPLVLPDPAAQDLGRALDPPSLADPLGRDHLGRSVLARLAHATRLSLLLAVLSAATAAVLGTAAGALAAWRGGWVDTLLRGLSEVLIALPALLVVLVVSILADGSLWTLYLGIALSQWVEYFRVVRARAGVVLGGTAVQAAGLLQLGGLHLWRRHLWPELAPLLVTLATFGLGTSVLALSTLGFVGVGLQPPTAELGLMVTEAFPYWSEGPWTALAPVLVLTALLAGLLGLRGGEPEEVVR